MSERKQCIACGSGYPMYDILDLGEPFLNDYVELSKVGSCVKFPLKLVWCENCTTGQLANCSPADWHFRQYWYRSGVTQTMREHLKSIVQEASDLVELQPHNRVLDIGANDGTLLRMYPKCTIRVGYEPARNLVDEAREGGNIIIPSYFVSEGLEPQSFKIVTALAMFYDVPDPLVFLRDVQRVLSSDGLFILQMNYAGAMLKNLAFDNIGHEHLAYYTLAGMVRLLGLAGLTVFRVVENDLNGGSFRLYCKHRVMGILQKLRNYKMEPDETVPMMLVEECKSGVGSLLAWKQFAEQVEIVRDLARGQVCQWRKDGKRVWFLGASTRGSTLTQYLGLDRALIDGASERDPRKVGKLMSGTWVPIYHEDLARQQADVFVVLPWAFKSELMEREKAFLERGGQMLFLLPQPVVVTKNGERKL